MGEVECKVSDQANLMKVLESPEVSFGQVRDQSHLKYNLLLRYSLASVLFPLIEPLPPHPVLLCVIAVLESLFAGPMPL
jgi:hypothetical protein